MRSPKQNVTYASILLKTVLIVVFGVALIMEIWCGYKVHILSDQKRVHKLAYAFVDNVSFGLLSVDVWRDQVVATARQELGSFKLSPEQEQDLRKEVDDQLHTLVNQSFAEINKPKKSLGDKLKKMVVKTLVKQDDVDKEIPGFSKKIMSVLTKPSSYKRVTNIADTAIAQISRKIYDSSVAATSGIMDSIYHTYGATDKASFEQRNNLAINTLKKDTNNYLYRMIGAAAAMLLLWILFHRRKNLALLYVIAVIGAMVLLFVGISTTIIEIDATLAKMDIHFLSGSLSFKTQSLFFQSQSIADVIRLLIGSGSTASVIVGMMIIIFCILFPVVILIATAMTVISPGKWAPGGWVDYFAFHANKWNMADVMMVAILMTFIGFNGIVDSTLSTLNFSEGSMTSITSNNTVIEPGYLVFIAFVVFSTTLIAVLKRTRKKEMAEQPVADISKPAHKHHA
jgi:hypothetical protein